MAVRLGASRFWQIVTRNARLIQSQAAEQTVHKRHITVTITALTAVTGYLSYKTLVSRPQAANEEQSEKSSNSKNERKLPSANHREITFLNFASVEYDGNVYMTPEDFLDSITEEKPRARSGRRRLRQNDVEKFLKNTPAKSKGSPHFFRDLLNKGIISYTEYLFLLCVLTKPRSGFQIAFNMFDTDGDQRVDKKEFLVLMDVFSPGVKHAFRKLDIENTEVVSPRSTSAKVNIWDLLQSPVTDDSTVVDIPNDTTLTVHFFGKKGNEVLTFQDFHRFMDNLQSEVLELEFNEFSHGMPTIQEQDFARILLRYTVLTKEAHEEYLDRLSKRIAHSQGISFSDFKEFCQFLNNIDDFALAMRIYTYADHPISEADFQRAVKACTGQSINAHLIHVVFQLFDTDGDGKLTHKEFIAVMKERLQRRTRLIGHHNRWDTFKSCVKKEMRQA